MQWVKAGFAGPGIAVGEDGVGYGYLTEAIKTRTLVRIQETIDGCRVRADDVVIAHLDAVLQVATAIYEHRRLTDERLDAVLRSAGFQPPLP